MKTYSIIKLAIIGTLIDFVGASEPPVSEDAAAAKGVIVDKRLP